MKKVIPFLLYALPNVLVAIGGIQYAQLYCATHPQLLQQAGLSLSYLILLLVLGNMVFYSYCRYHQVMDQKRLHKERRRLSRDLHDEIGGSLSGIVLYSHLAGSQVAAMQPAAAQHSLRIIHESAIDLAGRLSSWLSKAGEAHEAFDELLQNLAQYAQVMGAAKGIQVNVYIPKIASCVVLPAESRQHIYLIFKEAINNSVKYSNCKAIKYRVQYKHAVLLCQLIDDGRGFDALLSCTGNGLANMKSRAADIGAKLTIQSGSGRGTVVTLSCSIPQ